jgi:hypothetical protein
VLTINDRSGTTVISFSENERLMRAEERRANVKKRNKHNPILEDDE